MNSPNQLITHDLYFGAFLLSQGAVLAGLQMEGSSPKRVAFVFTGNGELSRLQDAFESGTAQANVVALKNSMGHLKDLMFDRMRSQRIGENHVYPARGNRAY